LQRERFDVMQELRNLTVPIAIAVSFFLFGFFVTANLFDMSIREIAVGLIAGAVGGMTSLVTVLHQARTRPAQPASVAS
jgi:hypothetical protein